jgi:hypothetical protein
MADSYSTQSGRFYTRQHINIELDLLRAKRNVGIQITCYNSNILYRETVIGGQAGLLGDIDSYIIA